MMRRPETAGPLLKGGGRGLGKKGVGDLAEFRILPGAAHQHLGRAADHRCSQKNGIAGGENIGLFGQFSGGLFHGERLPGEKCLVDEEVLCFQHPAVAGNQVAGGEKHHIAGHHFREQYFQVLAFPQYLPAHRHRLAQTLRRLSCPVFLNEIESHADDDDGADDEEAGCVSGEG